jgi:hypothetical protein
MVHSGSKVVSGDTSNRLTSPRTRSNAPRQRAGRLLDAETNTMIMFALFMGTLQTSLIILALKLALFFHCRWMLFLLFPTFSRLSLRLFVRVTCGPGLWLQKACQDSPNIACAS